MHRRRWSCRRQSRCLEFSILIVWLFRESRARLDREIGPCRFNKADAWQMILGANIRKPAILELTDFADGATFYGRFICNDQTFTARNDTHASNHASADKLIFHSDAREW